MISKVRAGYGIALAGSVLAMSLSQAQANCGVVSHEFLIYSQKAGYSKSNTAVENNLAMCKAFKLMPAKLISDQFHCASFPEIKSVRGGAF